MAATRPVDETTNDGSEKLLSLSGLCESVATQWDEWVTWADEGDVWQPSRVPRGFFAPKGGEGSGHATAFQLLLLIKAFREDKLLRCIANFVADKLGRSFAER